MRGFLSAEYWNKWVKLAFDEVWGGAEELGIRLASEADPDKSCRS